MGGLDGMGMAYLSVAGLAASSDVGTASLLDGDGDCGIDC
jgi:hypothetical protein